MRAAVLMSGLLVALAGLASCSDPCGPGDAAANGLKVRSPDDSLSVSYSMITAGANNDCPDPAAPDGVISLTIAGTQEGAAAPIVFCVPRPDKLQDGELNFGTDFQVIDVMAQAGGCNYTLVRPVDATGSASTSGMCENGAGKTGFALKLVGAATLVKKCTGMPDANVQVSLSGTFAVLPQ